ncbi:MAG: DUF3047 domain-containing protein [Deltaproteobacteria bacterium]|nr:MAG: DUF3047 domain-containing protein [Deltaproteobacteria bacterium]
MSARAKSRWSKVLGGALGLLLVGAYLAGADGSSILVVDRFQETNEANRGGYASGWMIAGNKERDSRIEIVREKATSFLCLVSKKDAFGLKKDIKFDVSKYPFLSWQWRVWENPKGGDIRSRATDDQAGQIYVLFPHFPGVVNTRAIGYIWDPATPRGHSGTSPSFAKMKYTVLQSGEGNLRRWAAESRNVHEDYRRLFQEDPPEAGGDSSVH